MSMHLSQADVARLLEEPSPLARAEVAGKLAQDLDSPRMTEAELQMAHEIVRLMARDAVASVREALAQNLRRAARLPHDVAVQLANDIEQVALPILQDSNVLTDEDLIAIVDKGTPGKKVAIAARPEVSPQVSDALINKGDEKVVTVLMSNAGAKISDKSFDKAMERFEASDPVKEAMVRRTELPVTVAERLTSLVSEQLKDYLVSHHEMSSSVASDLVLQSRERAIVELASGSSERDIEKLVQQMYLNKRLTPSIVMRALCMGDIMFFEAAVAIMANVPLVNARILIHDAGQLGLKTLYEKAGMPASMLPVIRTGLDVVHETEIGEDEDALKAYRARVIERILTHFEHTNSEDFDYLIAKLGDILPGAGVAPGP